MKKTLLTLLAAALILGLSACAGSGAQDEPAQENVSDVSEPAAEPSDVIQKEPAESQPPAAEPEPQPEPEEAEARPLIAFFSWSGNTASLAEIIQAQTGGDLFEIVTETPYSDDYDTVLDVAQQEQRDNARPALSGAVDRWESYQVIFVGYPNWWGDMPMAVKTFLESYDFTGKQVVPFCTHGSGGFGRSLNSVKDCAVGAEVLEGFEIAGSSVGSAADAVAEWLDGLALAAE